MKLLRNKRASAIYPTLIALAGMLALAACWYILLDKNATFEAKVGENQFRLIQQYQQGEDYLHYMDMAAEYSTSQAIAELASGGGYPSGSDCGEIEGYTLWISAGRECYPTRAILQSSFEEIFSQKMDGYSHLVYLPEIFTATYTLDYASEDPLSFVARQDVYTDFVTMRTDKEAELPPGAVSTKLSKDMIMVSYVELGGPIDYPALQGGG